MIQPSNETATTGTTGTDRQQPVMCSLHVSHPVTSYCRRCCVAVCVVCSDIEHAGHGLTNLVEYMGELRGNLSTHIASNQSTVAQLDRLIAEVGPQATALHSYVDSELHVIEQTVEEKRSKLHAEVDSRTADARRHMMDELSHIERELAVLTEGALVLDALSNREGIVEGRLGGLICEKITFAQFQAALQAPLHDPPRMLEMLALQLPTQSIQEVCDLITWTSITVEPTRQAFP